MALQDILKAIVAEADQQIENERKVHQKKLTTAREQSEQRTAKRKQEIAVQKEKRKDQMRAKSQAHAQMIERNAELKKKQDLLDDLYGQVVKKLSDLPKPDVEEFLKKCIKSIKEKGEIRPSKAHAELLKKIAPSEKFKIGEHISSSGGFIFVSEKEEKDFTFEHLVSSYLRPKTEVEIANELFTSA